MWIYVGVSLLLALCGYDVTQAATGGSFPDDTLIGRSTLFDNGMQNVGYGMGYHLEILPFEGDTSRYSLSNGFFTGFQWYNDHYLSTQGQVNLQLYRAVSWSSSDEFGNFTLAYETGWLSAEQGLNVFYFDTPIRFDIYDSISDVYYMAVLEPHTDTAPILYEHCIYSANSFTMEVGLSSPPAVGDEVYVASISRCVSYCMQGMFLSTSLASSTSGNCNLHIAIYEETNDITTQTPYPGIGLQSNYHQCDIIRVEREADDIEIKSADFDFPGQNIGDCADSFDGSVQITLQNSITDGGVNIDGFYCGKDGPSGAYSQSYVSIYTTTSSVSAYNGFKISHKSIESSSFQWFIIPCSLIGVIMIVTITCCRTCKKKKSKGQVDTACSRPQQAQSTQQYPKQHANPAAVPPKQSANPAAVPPKQPTPTAPPAGQNQPQTNANQVGSWQNGGQVNQYPSQPGYNQPGYNQPMINMGGYVVAQPGVAPPPYNAVVNTAGQNTDQYGVPAPAVYVEPK